ncbi:PfkB family carbohydrate kinase [Kaarinaea lacus]
MANILAVGIATIDIINTTDGFPQEDDEVRAVDQEIRRGGNATNSLVVLSQLGHHCQWLGCLADDASAQLIVNDLKQYNVNLEYCEVHRGGVTPTSYITLNSKNGSRTIVHYRNLPEMSAETFDRIKPADYNWIHFEGRNVEQTKSMLSAVNALQSKIPVSVEIEKQRENLEDLFVGADIYFFSRAFAKSESHDSADLFLQHYRKLIPDALLVCTWGSEGAYALENNQLYFFSAPKLHNVVDTVGAGDTFIAGFIHASLSGDDLPARLKFACEIAAKKCGTKGFSHLV